jgi:prepilin-type N-terminal cleavage/methylation domain-containing protein
VHALPSHQRRGFTLVEILITIVLLGIAGAMVIPSMGEMHILRVQAAVRTVISDITYAQSDAIAFQERRALMFDVPTSTYRLVEVPGDVLDPDNNTMYDPGRPDGRYIVDFTHQRFGNSRIAEALFDDTPNLIFDALGGPVRDPSGNQPGAGGTLRLEGCGYIFAISVEAFTGRTTVDRID